MESKFINLAKQYEPMIWSIIHSLHIYKNEEEFFQIGLIALWDAYQKYDQAKGKFSSYAYAFVKGKILNELTRESKHGEKCVYPQEEFWAIILDERKCEPLAEEMILASFSHLTENQRKYVVYTAIHQLTVKEIAQLEDVSVAAVKAWKRGAKEKFIGYL